MTNVGLLFVFLVHFSDFAIISWFIVSDLSLTKQFKAPLGSLDQRVPEGLQEKMAEMEEM